MAWLAVALLGILPRFVTTFALNTQTLCIGSNDDEYSG